MTWSTIPRSVFTPAIISTSFINGTGLKKWHPTTRSWRLHAVATAVTESDEVLVARMQSSGTVRSSSLNNDCLTSRFSTTASITMSTRPRSARFEVDFRQAFARAASSALIRPFSTALSIILCTNCNASSITTVSASVIRTLIPAAAAIWAIPRPIMPAPMMPRVSESVAKFFINTPLDQKTLKSLCFNMQNIMIYIFHNLLVL